MNPIILEIESKVYNACSLVVKNFKVELESKEYDACQFELNGLKIICRNSKITPKKTGQFVTFWKRSKNGPIIPFHNDDAFDFFLVNVRTETEFGQFVFPKSILIKKGIVSTDKKEGKRAFRVYPIWDTVKSKQAERTQKWQLDYFYSITNSTDFKKVKNLYKVN